MFVGRQLANLLDAEDLRKAKVAGGDGVCRQPGCLWSVILDCPENDVPVSNLFQAMFGEQWCRATWAKKETRSGSLFVVPPAVLQKLEDCSIGQCVRFLHDGVVGIAPGLAALHGIKTCNV
jgi:hypothetical protein